MWLNFLLYVGNIDKKTTKCSVLGGLPSLNTINFFNLLKAYLVKFYKAVHNSVSGCVLPAAPIFREQL